MTHKINDNEQVIGGELHFKTEAGTWRPYRGEDLEKRLRQLEDNPAPCFQGDDDDK